MDGGPWAFQGDSVMIAPYDGFTKPSSIELNHLDLLIQTHDLPDAYALLVESLAAKVGEALLDETNSFHLYGNFYHVKVRIDVREPLKNDVSIKRGEKR